MSLYMNHHPNIDRLFQILRSVSNYTYVIGGTILNNFNDNYFINNNSIDRWQADQILKDAVSNNKNIFFVTNNRIHRNEYTLRRLPGAIVDNRGNVRIDLRYALNHINDTY